LLKTLTLVAGAFRVVGVGLNMEQLEIDLTLPDLQPAVAQDLKYYLCFTNARIL
jgi:hypothetical protein